MFIVGMEYNNLIDRSVGNHSYHTMDFKELKIANNNLNYLEITLTLFLQLILESKFDFSCIRLKFTLLMNIFS